MAQSVEYLGATNRTRPFTKKAVVYDETLGRDKTISINFMLQPSGRIVAKDVPDLPAAKIVQSSSVYAYYDAAKPEANKLVEVALTTEEVGGDAAVKEENANLRKALEEARRENLSLQQSGKSEPGKPLPSAEGQSVAEEKAELKPEKPKGKAKAA